SHHALFDGFSRRILLREVFDDYAASVEERAFADVERRPFGEYVRWLRDEDEAASRAFWEAELEGFTAPVAVVPERRSGGPERRERHRFELPEALCDALHDLAGRNEVTLNTVLQAAWALLAGRYTGENDVVFGAPRMCRRSGFEGADGVVGLVGNTVPVRVRLHGTEPVSRLLGDLRAAWVRMRPHERTHLSRIQEWSGVPGGTPLFETVLGFENETVQDELHRRGGAWPRRTFDLVQWVSNPLTVVAYGRDRIAVEMLYDPARLDDAAIGRMGEHLVSILRAFAHHPGQPLDRIELLSPPERHHLLEALNPPAAPGTPSLSIHARFQAQAARNPDAVAVVFGGEAIRYGELDARSTQLARLLRARGVGPETRVGVCMERSLELVIALLAILKAGGAYVPLDPGHPRERLAFVLEDAGVSHLLCQRHLAARLPESSSAPLIAEPRWAQAAGESPAPVDARVEPHGLAYVMYTSGSTGTPKGVGVEHRGVVRLVCGASYARFGPGEVFLQAAPLSFDASTLEVWGALLHGARLVLMPAGTPSLEALGHALREHGVTTLWLTAGLFHAMVDEQLDALGGVAQLLAGGDVVPVAQVARVRERFPALRLINGYGPTENTTFTCCHTVDGGWAGGPLPIGRPITGTRVYVLDPALRLVPGGVAGELYAGGDGVARGYLGRPGPTADRFVPDPFGRPGARMYRTGDRVRWRADGTLEFLGRLDGQVKLRGFRIEPGEIEAALRRCAGVRDCVVAVSGDPAGERRLVGYVVGEADADALRAQLRLSLPEHMVPAAFVALGRLPLTPNGKVDRRALPAPGDERAEAHYAPPRTPVEEVLAVTWAEVLRRERVGVHDDFFALGGHSLLAMRVLSRVREALGVELPVRAIFERPTVAGVARWVEEIRRAALPVLPPILPVEHTVPPPLSFAQERLWLADQLEGAGALYNIPVARRLAGTLDVAALERALGKILRRHEALRTVFREVDGALEQVILPSTGFTLAVEDLSALPPAWREAGVLERAAGDAAAPFDLSAGAPFRARLLRLGDEEHVLLLSVHHVASDGWSMEVLARELGALYGAFAGGRPSPLPPLPVQYADHAVWQRAHLSGDALETHLAYWRKQLAGAPELLALPTDHPRPAVPTHRGARERTELPAAVVERLRALGRSEGATLYMVLLGTFQALLSRHGAGDDVVVGSPVAGRTRREVEELIGYFANTLVLRTDLSGDPSFREVLRRVRAATLGAAEHQDLPFDRLVAELRPGRTPSYSPLFQVTFTLQDPEPAEWSLPGVCASVVDPGVQLAKFDLLLAMDTTPRGLRVSLTYATDLFERGTIRRMLGHLERILAQVADDADVRLSALKLVGPDERETLLAAGRSTASFPVAERLDQRFERRAAERPHAPALTFEGETLSYSELNARANRLAHRLRALGVGPETRVGIALERSAELVVAILAVLKAGGAYVPLDPSYPADRIAFVLDDAAVPVLVTASHLAAGLPSFPGTTLCIDAEAGAIARESGDDPGVEPGPGALAYVIYTSGSTGKPKGVQVTHANAVRLFDATDAWFGFRADDVWTLFHSCAFDFSVWELWGALLHGGRLVVVPFLTTRSPEDFHRLLVDEGVTMLSQTPSAFKQLVQADLASGVDPRALALRCVVFGGEALDPQSLRPWMERHGDDRPRLVNMYGITETTVHVTYRVITRADLERPGSPIGVPIPDLSLYVLDATLEPVPPGVAGELFVGGAGVARGYLNRPELTAERFVRDPFSADPAARLYRTGDLARRRVDGEMEYLGRADQQVKIRGFRIETGEIEAVLLAHPSIASAAVVARDDGAGERRLVAYVVAASGAADPTVAELRAHLAGALPDYMVPAAFVPLGALPLTGNGKLDRRALPAPEDGAAAAGAGSYVAPETAAEVELAGVWREVLGVERVGIDDNYFALGGDSMRSVRLVAAARRRGLSLSIALIYRHQTVRGLAAAAGLAGPPSRHADPPAGAFALLDPAARAGLPDDVEDAYPVSQVQLGMLYHTERDPASLAYHEILAYRVHARFDEAALREALRRLAARHPLLRTSFDLAATPEPLQRVHRHVEIPLEVTDARALEPDARDAWMEREKGRGFDWATAPLVRFHAHLLADDEFRLVLVEHHVVLDGWSVASLMTELLRTYEALCDGRDDPTGAPPASCFRDFVALERQAVTSAESRDFWRRVVDGAPASVLPPRDDDGPPPPDDAPSLVFDLPGAVGAGLGRVAAEAGVPLKTVLLAVHLRVLALLGGRDDVVTGCVTSGRLETEDGDRVLGLFLNTVPLRVRMPEGTWLDLVRLTWAAEEAFLPHRRFPLAEIVREAGGHTPFDVDFNFVHFHVYDALAATGVRMEGDRFFQKTETPLVANFAVSPATGLLRLRVEYDPARLCEAQVRALGGWYIRALAAVAARPGERWDADGLLAAVEDTPPQLPGAGPAVEHGATLAQAFERRACLAPDAVAVVADGGAPLTYRELDGRANRLAHRLQRLGVGPEVRVGVCLERGPELAAAVLGVLKSGGVYVPLDPSHPAERTAFVLDDSSIRVVVTSAGLAAGLPGHRDRVVVRLDADADELSAEPWYAPPGAPHPEGAAYVLYTSGSTGRPKGVVVSHGALHEHAAAAAAAYGLVPEDRVLVFAAISFDPSLEQLLAPLVAGAAVGFRGPGVWSPAELADAVERLSLTVVDPPTAYWHALAADDAARRRVRAGVRLAIVGGEALQPATVAAWHAEPGTGELANAYGPTEGVVTATLHRTRAGDGARARVPIGTVLAGRVARVLDARMRPVPDGVPGELCLGGPVLARGYQGLPATTADRFVPDPCSTVPGARIYRTGDRVWRRADGTLEYLGRLDEQVKIRGFRVEPGEIEAVLRRYADVSDCVVVVQEHGPGERRLVAYVVGDADAQGLRAHLRRSLPEHMVPGAFVPLDALPLTPNGKVDRRALPVAATAGTEEAFLGPRDSLELRLTHLWEELLEVRPVGVRDDFFALGGHSLLALRLLAAVERLTGRRVPMGALLAEPTVERLARALRGEALPAAGPLVPIQPAGGERPLFLVHPAGGNVVSYAALARHLGPGFRVYGFQSRGLEDGELPHGRLEEMADDYLAAVRAIQPEGPYRLGGWSMGGVVAFEITRRLEAAGERVELLALVDSRPPGGDAAAADPDDAVLLQAFVSHLGLVPGPIALPPEVPGSPAGGERLCRAWEAARAADLVPPGMGLDWFERLWTVFRANVAATARYRPDLCASDLLLVQARERAAAATGERARWEALTRGAVRTVTIGGDHFSVVREPHVRELASVLADALAEAAPDGRRVDPGAAGE
ncbi:MAG TPA: amino acid adenylation domain-containing protein, partial [Longimicrobium sp.]|nr:amino acid adenylation domain-containing protein [Longimicrobium sp.]